MFHRFSFSNKYNLNISVLEQAVLMKINFYDFLKYTSFSIHKIWKAITDPKMWHLIFEILHLYRVIFLKTCQLLFIVVTYTDSHFPESTKSKFQVQKSPFK